MRVLLTGGAGFIGHHVVEHLLKETDWEIVSLDRLDTSGNLNRLHEVIQSRQDGYRLRIVFHDLRAAINAQTARLIGPVRVILHLAAATHVDRSIEDPVSFVLDNVLGTAHLLEYARKVDPQHVLYFGTDEVFGPAAKDDAFAEWDRYRSGNPYAATKAGAEELCLAYHNTYKLPVIITHCMNVFGERQHPEKFIPSTIRKVRDGETVLIHADQTKTRPGSRFYIHARNVAAALVWLLTDGPTGDYLLGQKFNIVGEKEVDNLELATLIASAVGKPLDYLMVDFHSSRPGHDLRYALDGSRMYGLGWKLPVDFERSLERTVRWSLAHPEWL